MTALSIDNAAARKPSGLPTQWTTAACLIALLCLPSQPVLAASGSRCNANAHDQVRLQIAVSGMRTTKGNITITIYPDDSAHFLNGAYKLARQHVAVTLPVTHACLVVAAPGRYAVALFGDENNSGHLATNFLGIPTEGYGFSNNPTLFLGPPKLKQVLITAHPGDNPIAIQMKYY
jgi:uncharacterized protein (DUF2141 family)